MSRAKRKEVTFNKDSVLMLLQEIYMEIADQRNTAIRIQNKMLAMMKEPEDMQLMGPIIKEQQKIINDCVEKKLSLAKIQSSIWEKSKNEKADFTIDDLDVDLMDTILKKDDASKSSVYKLTK